MDIAKAADRFVKHLTRHGVSVERRQSSMSSSVYLECLANDCIVRVRASDHVAKPTYQAINGHADYEFGTHDEAQGDEINAVAYVLRQADIAFDAPLRAIMTKRAKAAEAARAERIEHEAAIDRFNDEMAADSAALIEWAGARWIEANDPTRSAKSRKRARQKLRAQFEASK